MLQQDQNWLEFMSALDMAMYRLRKLKTSNDDIQLLKVQMVETWRMAENLDNSKRLPSGELHEMSKDINSNSSL